MGKGRSGYARAVWRSASKAFAESPLALWVALLPLAGCAEGVGGVELSWAFFDRDVHTVYPRGDQTDSCALGGRAGDAARPYDLNVRLTVLEACEEEDPIGTCDPVVDATFECDRFRGLIPELPSSDEPYLMHVEVRVSPEGEDAFTAAPDCVAAPGPRLRTVRAGRVTDLAVYQFVIDATRFDSGAKSLDRRLDVEACRP